MWTRSSIGETLENFTMEMTFGEEQKLKIQFSGFGRIFIWKTEVLDCYLAFGLTTLYIAED